MDYTMEKIIALAKSRGFVYPGSEIYGGLAKQCKKSMVAKVCARIPL